MQDTGLSLFHEAYRHGGGGQRGVMAFGGKSQGTEPPRCDAEDRQEMMSAWADHPHYDEYWCARCSHTLYRRLEMLSLCWASFSTPCPCSVSYTHLTLPTIYSV